MELAIPLIALGGMYIISNQNKKDVSNKDTNNASSVDKENYSNMGATKNYLPNTNIPPQNYPIIDNNELVDTVQNYPNPNVATDKYFNQNAYQTNQRSGVNVDSNIQQIYSLSGNYMNTQEFRHNNMVPFNGAKPKGQIYNNNVSETILDNYVGSGSQIIKKIEQAPLFKPQENVQWAYGAPNMSDFYQSRVNPAMKNNMVKPFDTIRVGPGLDKGYSSSGSGGYNSGMEARDLWLPKTVDELRITTNPKEEFTLIDHQGPAQAQITNVGILGKVEKNRPDTFFINTQDRWLTTTGAEKAGQLVPEHIVKPSVRNETTTYQTGTPNAMIKTASYVPCTTEETKRQQLQGYQAGHSKVASGGVPHTAGENNIKSHTNYNNNRSINQQPQTFGSGFTSSIGAVIAPIMDILKPQRKEEYCNNIRTYGNISSNIPSNYVLTQSDIPNTTVKETTIYQTRGNIGNQVSGAYSVTEQQPISNQRDTTNCSQIGTPGGASVKIGNRQYDADYRQTNNDSKEQTIISSGRTNQGNAKILNPNMNICMSKCDTDRENNRLWTPSAVIPTSGTIQTYGSLRVSPQKDLKEIGIDRINPDILTAIKENPYVTPYTSIVY
jgi:hypothetical protein